MATKKPTVKKALDKKKAPVKAAKKSGKSIQHCKKCGERGHNLRRHKKLVMKSPAKK